MSALERDLARLAAANDDGAIIWFALASGVPFAWAASRIRGVWRWRVAVEQTAPMAREANGR